VSERRSPWWRKGAWEGIVTPGRFGAQNDAPGLVITPRHDFSFAFVIGSEGDRAVTDHVLSRYGIEPPQTPRIVPGEMLDLIWSGPSQWLAWSRRSTMPAELASGLNGIGAVTDQSDARAVLRLRGARVRDALAKGCPVDLHPRAFRRGDTVITTIGGIGTQIWWPDVDDALFLAVSRSMAGSFWSWLMPSAQEFGVEVLPAKDG
jgi:heterotetrameric sarcosine oxidase gamma subunit